MLSPKTFPRLDQAGLIQHEQKDEESHPPSWWLLSPTAIAIGTLVLVGAGIGVGVGIGAAAWNKEAAAVDPPVVPEPVQTAMTLAEASKCKGSQDHIVIAQADWPGGFESGYLMQHMLTSVGYTTSLFLPQEWLCSDDPTMPQDRKDALASAMASPFLQPKRTGSPQDYCAADGTSLDFGATYVFASLNWVDVIPETWPGPFHDNHELALATIDDSWIPMIDVQHAEFTLNEGFFAPPLATGNEHASCAQLTTHNGLLASPPQVDWIANCAGVRVPADAAVPVEHEGMRGKIVVFDWATNLPASAWNADYSAIVYPVDGSYLTAFGIPASHVDDFYVYACVTEHDYTTTNCGLDMHDGKATFGQVMAPDGSITQAGRPWPHDWGLIAAWSPYYPIDVKAQSGGAFIHASDAHTATNNPTNRKTPREGNMRRSANARLVTAAPCAWSVVQAMTSYTLTDSLRDQSAALGVRAANPDKTPAEINALIAADIAQRYSATNSNDARASALYEEWRTTLGATKTCDVSAKCVENNAILEATHASANFRPGTRGSLPARVPRGIPPLRTLT